MQIMQNAFVQSLRESIACPGRQIADASRQWAKDLLAAAIAACGVKARNCSNWAYA